MATMLQLRVDARPELIRPLRNSVARRARKTGLSDSELYALKLCVTEALTNVVTHAYPEDKPGPLELCMREVADELEIVVADQGREPRGVVSRDQGGFGLGFISRLMNRCTFTVGPGGTRVEMRFRLPRPRARSIEGQSPRRDQRKGVRLFSVAAR
jgi:serine/threonine-protein kinase RsbW